MILLACINHLVLQIYIQFIERTTILKYIRQDLVRNTPAIFFPIFSIFLSTSDIVAVGSMDEQDHHETYVKIGQEMREAAGETVSERTYEITNVVEMTRDSPPARAQQWRILLHTERGHKLCRDVVDRPAPNAQRSFLLQSHSEDILLMVY